MAITRRQFITTLSALAAAAGIGQADLSRITEAFGHGAIWNGGWSDKPKVIWVHGAECTGCSTSLLGLFEDATGTVDTAGVSTLAALDLAVGGSGDGNAVLNGTSTTDTTGAEAGHPWGHRTLHNTAFATGTDPDGIANASAVAVDIADVLIDFIALNYHETVMAMGGDLAFNVLDQNMSHNDGTPFVLVVEGAVQDATKGGYWRKNVAADSTQTKPWCAIARNDAGTADMSFDNVVGTLAGLSACKAVIAVGQCATFGGYPACIGPGLFGVDPAKFDTSVGQTGAQGVYDFLKNSTSTGAQSKVINVPGCPVNPWWVVLTVVAWMVDATAILGGGSSVLHVLGAGLAINPAAVDNDRRLNLVYNYPLHGGYCPRYADYAIGKYATHPGDDGCLALIGCKGPATKSLCARHGWNNQQPQNKAANLPSQSLSSVLESVPQGTAGGYCITAGAPCMGCSEKGYPDAFSPFVVNR